MNKRKHAEADKSRAIIRAMIDGIKRAEERGLTKPMDVATSISVTLKTNGFTIIRRRDGGTA